MSNDVHTNKVQSTFFSQSKKEKDTQLEKKVSKVEGIIFNLGENASSLCHYFSSPTTQTSSFPGKTTMSVCLESMRINVLSVRIVSLS